MRKILLFALLFVGQNFLMAQNAFKGVIEYEATLRIDVESIKARNPEAAANIPDVFNYNEKLHVNGDYGKLERIIAFGGRGGNVQQQQKQMNRFRRFIPETYWNFKENKTYTVSSLPRDSVNMDRYVIANKQDSLAEVKLEKKTKKILGYECKKATVKFKDDNFTVWYTTDLGFTYSPMPQSSNSMKTMRGPGGMNFEFPAIIIDKAVILSIEGTDIGFEAKKITPEEVALETVKIPEDAQKVTQEEYAELMKKRRQNFVKMMGGGRN
ncbi:MAG: GLPGLI family protein [Thermonemataceae bacterium]|nr:GLPGLI family protein [Thermonemataceae bacterium]